MKKELGNKIEYITFIQVISAFAVVFLHTNGCFWNFDGVARYWKTANIIESFFYFAVPMFFMISGITLIDYNEKYTLKEYLKKRINKTFIPFLVWSVIGILYFRVKGELSNQIGDICVRSIIDGIINSKVVVIYWFFGPLFIIYLSIPLFAAVTKEKRKEIFCYLIFGYSIFNIIIPFLAIFKWIVPVPFYVGVVSGYLIWPILGYVLHNYQPKMIIKVVLIIVSVLAFLLHCVGTYAASIQNGYVDRTFKGYNSLPCYFYSIGVFIFLQFVGEKVMKTKLKGLFVFLSKYTFPIYLIHWYVHDICINVLNIDSRSIIYRLLGPFAIVSVCIGITWVIRKIPIIRKIVP